VVGAVVLGGKTIEGLTDSKKLSKKRREALDSEIRERADGYGLGWVHADEIDELGLSESLRLATKRAVEQIKTPYHEIIIDGTINFLDGTTKGRYVKTMPKADLLVPSVSAASIIAKVARDNYMAAQDEIYPGYKFASHVGYGTAAHVAAITEHGVTPLHRLSFAPLAKYKGTLPETAKEPAVADKTTKQTGNEAEEAAAIYLELQGHEVLERNWKTKYCEIDIVSAKDGTIYFNEVKYRKQQNQGGGLAAITKKKLSRMEFAAKIYIQAKKLHQTDARLAALSLTGEPAVVEEYLILE
jgi:ribonuclease HII